MPTSWTSTGIAKAFGHWALSAMRLHISHSVRCGVTSSTQPVVHFSTIEKNKLSKPKHVGKLWRTTGLAGEVTALESPEKEGVCGSFTEGQHLVAAQSVSIGGG